MGFGRYGEPGSNLMDRSGGLAGTRRPRPRQVPLFAVARVAALEISGCMIKKTHDELSRMIHEILPVGMLQCNCSIFGDEQTKEAIVIDPGDNIDEILAILKRHGLKLKAIVITHAHIDHIGGAAKLKKATGAPVHMNASA